MRHTVDYLHSLQDALVSINVPNDKARAVVDAMERDMGTTIATKTDLQLLRQELIASLASRDELAGVRTDVAALRQDHVLLRKDLEVLSAGFRRDLDVQSIGFHKDLELLSTTMTVRLGSMLIVGLSVLFAALKLTE
jgi:hypothetical protein